MNGPIVLLLILAAVAFSAEVSIESARLGVSGSFGPVSRAQVIEDDAGKVLAYLFTLEPTGYVITSTVTGITPVIAYSLQDSPGERLIDLVRRDLAARLSFNEFSDTYRLQWNEFLAGEATPAPLAQWPPEGSTPTGGWLEENWTQGAPYNMYCPMDLKAGSRSVAGCPAVAMGSILNFHECTNGTRFDDDDDYYHNYNEYYWIDDDHEARDFPSWPELNILMEVLETHYVYGDITDSDKGAVVYASGAACKQVYTASISGTFGVEQAFDAYQRFGFTDCELLYDDADSLLERMAQNMMDAMPIHLAIIDEVPQYGHNVVVDGYNTDGFFHINFGWGGSSNGWYSFPLSGMPYGMNFIEGVVLDIIPNLQSVEGQEVQGVSLCVSLLGNPVDSQAQFHIHASSGGTAEIALYSLDGRLEARENCQLTAGENNLSLETGDLHSGVYLVRVEALSQSASALLTCLR